MDYNGFFQGLGFEQRETHVYMALLERGALSLSALARITKLHRVALYQLLPRMVEKKIIFISVRGKRKVYHAENPEKLEEIFIAQKEAFHKTLDALKKIHQTKKNKPFITFREGQRGINDTYIDIVTTLPRDATFYRYSSRKSHKVESYFDQEYYHKRDAKNLQRFVIAGEEKGRAKKKELNRSLKIIPKKQDLFDDDVSQIIYGDKVAFIDYENKVSFIIESKKIATFQKKLFTMLYKTL